MSSGPRQGPPGFGRPGKDGVDGKDGAPGGAGVFITTITGVDGAVGLPTYKPTTPANLVLESVVCGATKVRVTAMAHGGLSKYTPTVIFNGVEADIIAQTSTARVFTASATIDVPEDGIITVENDGGGTDVVMLIQAAAGPEILSVTWGQYPGSQTALKQGDSIAIEVVVSNSAVSCTIQGGGAVGAISLNLGAIDGAIPGYRKATGIATVTSQSGDVTSNLVAVDAVGSSSEVFTSPALHLMMFTLVGKRNRQPGRFATQPALLAGVDTTLFIQMGVSARGLITTATCWLG